MNTSSKIMSQKYVLPLAPWRGGRGVRLLFLLLFLLPSSIFSPLALWRGVGGEAFAQDSRNRIASTIIADGLAQLPAPNLDVLEQVMSEIADTGAEGVESLAAMLGPSDQGKNATFQYAIDGLTSYVSQKGREAQAAAVKKGLEAAIVKCTDEGNKTFLKEQLAKLNPTGQVVVHATEDLKTVAANSRVIAEFLDKVNAAPAKKQGALLLKALKSDDRQLRNTALTLATELELKDFDLQAMKFYNKANTDTKADILRWLGNTKNASHMALVSNATKSADSQVANAAIEAAGRIGGTEALTALIEALDGPNAKAANAALTAFNGDIKQGILTALQTQGAGVSKDVVALAGERRISEAYQPLTQLIGKDGVHYAAMQSLAQIVKDNQYADLLQRFQPYPENYYGLLAQRASSEDILQLVSAAKEGSCKQEAAAALLKVDKADVVSPLYDLATSDAAGRDKYLGRALTLTKSANWPRIDKYQLYKQALEMKPSADVANNLLSALGTLGNEPALNLAAEYMDVKANDLAAAHAVTDLIEKNEALQRGAHIREMLLKAQNVFKSHTENADAGYAVDQVNTILPKIVDDPNAVTAKVSKLTEEEEKAGFELLFDGTNLDKWHGGKANYLPIDGAIYVSANYGAEGNLYTNKTYSDFVYRFEFCFVRPGINNGVGIRTKDGVDAAYDGMEIQILDHDDPIYKGLREYQVHGSVYGIIPAKRIKHKPLGEWNYEEIRAEGDHITVTLNGEVLVNGNIREACQGHNMAPEGEKSNPYTVDHRSHPGLFNKEGFISFCGHGEGLKIRNVRVLDLTAQKAAKKTTKKRK